MALRIAEQQMVKDIDVLMRGAEDVGDQEDMEEINDMEYGIDSQALVQHAGVPRTSTRLGTHRRRYDTQVVDQALRRVGHNENVIIFC